ncbi:MAG: hypothetical protein L0211_14935 [Planctomycetaceae bacterium]|nr:hypothetical protein [Planctomycetaceae bacterium]
MGDALIDKFTIRSHGSSPERNRESRDDDRGFLNVSISHGAEWRVHYQPLPHRT